MSIEKVKKVINSCKTLKQLEVARKFAGRYFWNKQLECKRPKKINDRGSPNTQKHG